MSELLAIPIVFVMSFICVINIIFWILLKFDLTENGIHLVGGYHIYKVKEKRLESDGTSL